MAEKISRLQEWREQSDTLRAEGKKPDYKKLYQAVYDGVDRRAELEALAPGPQYEDEQLRKPDQEEFLAMLCFSEQAPRFADKLTPDFFGPPQYQDIAKRVIGYVDTWNEPPGRSHLDTILDDILSKQDERAGLYADVLRQLDTLFPQLNEKFVEQNLDTFIKDQLIKIRTVQLLKGVKARNSQAIDTAIDDLQRLKNGKSQAQARDFAAWLKEPISAKDWLVEETFERGKMGMLTGLYESGKTTDIWFLAFALATGREWLDRPVKQPYQVLLLDFEHQAEDFRAVMQPLFDVTPGYTEPAYVEYGRRPTDMLQELRQKIALHKPDFIIIDNYMKCLALKKTDEAAVTEVLAPYEDVAAESNAFLLWLHHNRKSKDETGAGLDFLGSVTAPGMMSVMLRKEMKRDQETGEQHFYMEMTKRRRGIRFMPKTEILFQEDGSQTIYQAGGLYAQQQIDKDSTVILEMLKTLGKDMARCEIVSQAKDKGVSVKRVDKALKSLTQGGLIEKKVSKGRRHFYTLKES